MASCITNQWANAAPQVRLTVTASSSTETTQTYSYKLEYIASSPAHTSSNRNYTVKIDGVSVDSGSYNINNITGTHIICSGTKTLNKGTSYRSITFSVTFEFSLNWSGHSMSVATASGTIGLDSITTYKIQYTANGGSGAPGMQTKYHGTAITLSTVKPTRTGYTFQGWGTSASDTTVDYAPKASYTANAAITLYAIWKANTYTVSYNANGGSGAPGNQTKTYGVALTLSSTKPTRAKYNFLGWGTSASSTTVSYAAGVNYTANSSITLYAIWESAYTKPIIHTLIASRCDSAGNSLKTGTYARIMFNWQCTYSVSSITITWTSVSGGTGSTTVSASGTSGSVNTIIGSNGLSVDSSYTITVTVADSGGSSPASITLSGTGFIIDVLDGGKGLSFGKPAELENTVEFGWGAKFSEPVYGNVFGLNTLPQIPNSSDFNNYMTIGCYAVYGNAAAETMSNIPAKVAGRLEVSAATGEGIRLAEWSYLRQRYIPYDLTYPTWERDIMRSSDNVWTYGEWYRTTLSKRASNLVYHEQKVLWSGGLFMTAGHTIDLSEAVSAQPNGIVLTFSRYITSAEDSNFVHVFVPKQFVSTHKGYGHSIALFGTNFTQNGTKYLYINDTYITGHDNNNQTFSATTYGRLSYWNDYWVLRFVYGV